MEFGRRHCGFPALLTALAMAASCLLCAGCHTFSTHNERLANDNVIREKAKKDPFPSAGQASLQHVEPAAKATP